MWWALTAVAILDPHLQQEFESRALLRVKSLLMSIYVDI